MKQKSKWQQALDEKAVPLDDFFDELYDRIDKQYDKLEAEAASTKAVMPRQTAKHNETRLDA